MKQRIFKNWIIDRYVATSPCGKYRLWVADGWLFFYDYETENPFIDGLSLFDNYWVWRKLKKEMRLRAKEVLQYYIQKQ